MEKTEKKQTFLTFNFQTQDIFIFLHIWKVKLLTVTIPDKLFGDINEMNQQNLYIKKF